MIFLSHHRRPAPHSTAPDQDELRRRRRARMRAVYSATFSLSREVEAVCDPLARRVTVLPRPLPAKVWVSDLADAVHELVSVVVGWLAESDHSPKHDTWLPNRVSAPMRSEGCATSPSDRPCPRSPTTT